MEEFIKKFINAIECQGYTKHIDDPLTYKKVHVTQPPVHRMMINGQLFEQESPPIRTEVLVEHTGNGSIDDRSFAVIKFSVIQENEPPQSISQAFYDEDFDELIGWLEKL